MADGVLEWAKRERERHAKRARRLEAADWEPEPAPEPREAWRARARYARGACSWADAGVAPRRREARDAPRARSPARAEQADMQLIISASGRVHVSVLPLSALPDGGGGGGHADGGPAADPAHVELTMVSQQQLFAHQLYPAAVAIARLLDGSQLVCAGLSVLELGAGPALPCIVAALNGARALVATDFPDAEMLRNTEANLRANLPAAAAARCRTVGHAWGRDCAPVLAALCELGGGRAGFDLVVLSDLLYELEHEALLRSCAACLSARPCARLLVAFQPHDPVNLHRQLRFFALAAQPPFELQARRLLCLRAPAMFDAADAAGPAAWRVHVHLLRRAAHRDRPWGRPFAEG